MRLRKAPPLCASDSDSRRQIRARWHDELPSEEGAAFGQASARRSCEVSGWFDLVHAILAPSIARLDSRAVLSTAVHSG